MEKQIKYTKHHLLKVANQASTLREANILGGILPRIDMNIHPQNDKRPWHFFDVYESLGLDRNYKYNLLEIGNRWCGSLWGWRIWLPESNIYGLDIDPETQKFSNGNPELGVKVFQGDQTDVDLLKNIHKEAENLHIIIDDGGHTMTQINTSFKTLWPLLEDGGVYIIEDLQCCYWPGFEGGYKKEKSSMEMIKSLFDNIHACYYKEECKDNKSKRAQDLRVNEPSNYLDKSVASIHLYDSIAIIYKQVKPKLQPTSLECNITHEVFASNNQKIQGINEFLNPQEKSHYKNLYNQTFNSLIK